MAGVCSGANFPNCLTDTVSPDPDIAGIGVILSFTVINGLTIIVASVSMLFFRLEELELSSFDLAINKWLKRRGLKPLSSSLTDETIIFWLGIQEKVLLSLSDTQLLTGIAILIAGYLKCNISVYHSTIVADLAWFASGTHLASLTTLKHYLRRYPATKAVRVVLLLVMAGLFLALTIYQGHRDWYKSTPIPAQCLFADGVKKIGGLPSVWMGLNIFFIVLAYGASICALYPETLGNSSSIVESYKTLIHWNSDTIKSLWKTIQGKTAGDVGFWEKRRLPSHFWP
jgi:hypothetical protein